MTASLTEASSLISFCQRLMAKKKKGLPTVSRSALSNGQWLRALNGMFWQGVLSPLSEHNNSVGEIAQIVLIAEKKLVVCTRLKGEQIMPTALKLQFIICS